jgi:hypothetical protein
VKIPEILLIETRHKPGSLASVLRVVGESGLLVENLSAVRRDQDRSVWELTLEFDEVVDQGLIERIDRLPGSRVIGRSDRVFDRHRGDREPQWPQMESRSTISVDSQACFVVRWKRPRRASRRLC